MSLIGVLSLYVYKNGGWNSNKEHKELCLKAHGTGSFACIQIANLLKKVAIMVHFTLV